jgi:hypothetical protein
MALALGACVGTSPVVGTDPEATGATAGSSGSGGTGGSAANPVSTNHTFTMVPPVDDPTACFAKPLPVDSSGAAVCTLIMAPVGFPAPGGPCDCEASGRVTLSASARTAAAEEFARYALCSSEPSDSLPSCDDLCFCAVPQAVGEDRVACQNDPNPPSDTQGWCYVSPEQGVGAPDLVEECDPLFRRRIRYLNVASPDESALLSCFGEVAQPPAPPSSAAGLGEPCLPEEELNGNFGGYGETEVNVITGTPGCASSVCVVNHFRGRASCPYGQTDEQRMSDPACFLPESELAVTVPVIPQLQDRQAKDTVICSCRCDGPGPGEYCTCPSTMECAPLIQDVGLPDSGFEDVIGSYCIPKGTAYDARSLGTAPCESSTMSCGDPRPY